MAHHPKGPSGPSVTDVQTLNALHRFLMRLVKNDADARDLAQDAQLKVLDSETAQGARRPVPYLYVIAGNLAMAFLKQKYRDPITYDTEAADGLAETLPAEHRDICEQLIDEEQLDAVLKGMPENYRRVLEMQRADGLTHKEIADRLGWGLERVKKTAVRARALARKLQWD